MPFTPYSAKSAAVRIGATTLTAKQWTVSPEAEELDITNFEGSGFYECIAGIKKCNVTIELDDNGAANLFDGGGGGVTAGATLSTVKLYLSGTSSPFWLFPSLYVKNPQMKADVKAAMTDTIQAVGTGTFTYPTGNVS